MNAKTDKRKITVQLWSPLLKKLNEMTAAACLNRDAYLDVVFANEAAMLRSELAGKRNSDQARGFIKQCFAELKDLCPVSLTLTCKTANALTEACDQANTWRDVFVNRVIYLLLAKSSAIEAHFHFSLKDHTEAIFEDGRVDMLSLLLGPRLTAIRGFINDDPFLSIRTAIRNEYQDEGTALHTTLIGTPTASTAKDRGLAGFNAYLEDKDVPGSAENQEWQKFSDDLFNELVSDIPQAGAIK